MAQAGVAPVLAGSMSEAHHLTPEERVTLIKAARSALDQAGLTQVPIIAGTGVGSTRESISLSKQAAAAGADYAIVITSGYYAGALAGNTVALKAFFTDIADASPIPVMIYNCELSGVFIVLPTYLWFVDPGASGGINLDSDIITDLAKHPNICGVKLTCATDLKTYSLRSKSLYVDVVMSASSQESETPLLLQTSTKPTPGRTLMHPSSYLVDSQTSSCLPHTPQATVQSSVSAMSHP
jgi:dihydrodipicolinate synthase/N-acetylneuraminate lyase